MSTQVEAALCWPELCDIIGLSGPAGGLATEGVTRRLQLYIPAVPAVTAPVLLQPLLLYTAGEAMSATVPSLQSGGAGQVSLERLQECLRAAAAGLLDCGGVQLGVVHSQHPGRVPGARPQVRVTVTTL